MLTAGLLHTPAHLLMATASGGGAWGSGSLMMPFSVSFCDHLWRMVCRTLLWTQQRQAVGMG